MADVHKQRILIVDDEPIVTDFVCSTLGDIYEIDVASDGTEGLARAKSGRYDMFILDVMMPGMDGFRLCQNIRTFSPVPVMFLSGRDSETDKVTGLELGADDYITKPFGVRELLARTRALLRRADKTPPPQEVIIEASGLLLNRNTRTVTGDKGPIDLTHQEFELLACLMKNAGNVVSRDKLLKEAWDWDFATETKTVDVSVKRLRSKMEAAGYSRNLVQTVRGYGYKCDK